MGDSSFIGFTIHTGVAGIFYTQKALRICNVENSQNGAQFGNSNAAMNEVSAVRA